MWAFSHVVKFTLPLGFGQGVAGTDRWEMRPKGDFKSDTHPLEELRALRPEQVQRLKAQWVDSVEALVALGAAAPAKAALAELLGISNQDLAILLEQAAELIGPERAAELSLREPGGPTGMMLTEEQKKRFGIQ